jgi:ornithine decarboxylase
MRHSAAPGGLPITARQPCCLTLFFWGSLELYENTDALAVVRALRPDEPITLLRPHAATRAARFFVEKFQGKSLYAVKANPSPALLELLWASGITHYDVASLGEVRLVNKFLPDAKLCFMHPVKSERAISQAYHNHGVRTFSLDSHDELEKIVRATTKDGVAATDLELCVRIRVSSEHAKLSLASKFGADPSEVADLLVATRQVADALGICFHVGSQAMTPAAYAEAMEHVRAAIVAASVTVDIVDVGGGFPSVYPGMEPPPLESYFEVIHRSFEDLPISYSAELWCEPGRALCAEYASLLVKVEKRRGSELFINDGAYGSLFDAAHIGWRFPVALQRSDTNIGTIWTIWQDRSSCLTMSRPATISRSGCWALMAARCEPSSTALAKPISWSLRMSQWRVSTRAYRPMTKATSWRSENDRCNKLHLTI